MLACNSRDTACSTPQNAAHAMCSNRSTLRGSNHCIGFVKFLTLLLSGSRVSRVSAVRQGARWKNSADRFPKLAPKSTPPRIARQSMITLSSSNSNAFTWWKQNRGSVSSITLFTVLPAATDWSLNKRPPTNMRMQHHDMVNAEKQIVLLLYWV